MVFLSFAFGLASGPPLWGPLVALAARFAQSLMVPWELRMQAYVDDPILTVAGRKARTAPTVEWIGGQFSLLREGEPNTLAAHDGID